MDKQAAQNKAVGLYVLTREIAHRKLGAHEDYSKSHDYKEGKHPGHEGMSCPEYERKMKEKKEGKEEKKEKKEEYKKMPPQFMRS